MFGMYFDPLYWVLLLPCMVLSGLCAIWVRTSFSKWSKVTAKNGMTGAEIAAAILSWNNITDVRIEETQGMLSDHYDPTSKALRLSSQNFHGRSVAAIGVAAHEVGHAIQHARAYVWLTARSKLVPISIVGSNLSWIFLVAGIALQIPGLALVGVVLFGVSTLFTIVTLPVEFDASARALQTLEDGRILVGDELTGAKRVLRAAASTYVAAAITAVTTLIYFLLRSGLLGRSDD